jgi:hypothetical protein
VTRKNHSWCKLPLAFRKLPTCEVIIKRLLLVL